MKICLSLLIGTLIGLVPLSAQISITAADYFPVLGDTLYVAFDTLPPAELELQAAGGPRLWDFSALTNDFQQNRVFEPVDELGASAFPTAEMMRGQGPNARGYYRTNGDRFELVGFVGVSQIGIDVPVSTAFEPPYVDRWDPLNFIDDHDMTSAFDAAVGSDALPQEILDLLPIIPDSLRIRTAIERRDLVDAYGGLKLPDGLTYEVLREKRTEIRDITIEAKTGILPWTDITPIILEFLPQLGDIAVDTAVSYTFWSNDAVTPLARVNLAADGESIQTVEFREHPLAAPVVGNLPADFSWQLYPNPGPAPVRLATTGLPGGDYRVEIRNVGGQLLRHEVTTAAALAAGYTLSASGRLTPGVYFVQLRQPDGQLLAVRRWVVAE
jgi:hypothetical protein